MSHCRHQMLQGTIPEMMHGYSRGQENCRGEKDDFRSHFSSILIVNDSDHTTKIVVSAAGERSIGM